ncbi:transcription initiation protein [Mycobacterium sp. MS1601]|nr:YciI family protein [Mycobacterium sp. MS1601]AQA06133.1 transcription initiation protein [Mycobacterium sp. MS1601]
MHYLAILRGPEPTGEYDAAAEEAIMAEYTDFNTRAGHAIRSGDALCPAADAVRISGGVVTDGPFAEGAEIAGGYYVFEADNLDDALQLARHIPARKAGGVEVWPMVGWEAPEGPLGADWFALLLEPPGADFPDPGTPEWNADVAQHEAFGRKYGEHILGGAALHPPSTATTVKVRDGDAIFTDGPYAEGAEVAGGFYLLRAADKTEAVEIAAKIPVSVVELRQLANISAV